MMKLAVAGLAALGATMTMVMTSGTAGADEAQVEGNYATLAACQTDGPHVEVTYDNDRFSHWDCREGGDGLYYLWLSN